MYIDVVPNRNSPPAVLLRQAYREDGKVKKKTLANLSHLPAPQVEALRRVFSGNFAEVLGEPECGPIYGVLAALDQIATSVGLSKVLGDGRSATLIKLLIFARIAHQGSRLSAVRWAQNHAVNEVIGLTTFDEDDLYESLDWLDGEQERIENELFKRYVKQSGQPLALVLYDVTSSYFEGERNELAEYGYNRDGKRGKLQIVIGLLTGPDGEPLAVEVFRGNRTDPTTVEAQVTKLAERFKVKEIVFVGDRGMVKAKGKIALHARSFQYITAITDPQIRKLLKTNVFQPGLFDETIVEVQHGDLRYVLRLDEMTRAKEQHRRNDKLKIFEKKIAERNTILANGTKAKPENAKKALENWAKRYKLASFVTVSLSGRTLSFAIDADDLKESGLLDGCYVLETDVRPEGLTTKQVDARYRDLQKVERDFRSMKSGLLEVRPIFLRKAERTRAHVFVSMLSLKIVRAAEQRLRKAFGTTENPHGLTLDDTLTSLSRLCLNIHTLGDDRVVTLPRADAQQKAIQQSLGVSIKLPHKSDA